MNSGCLLWIDDSLLYATSFDEHLRVLSRLLDAAIYKGLRFNIEKCVFIAKEISWCGRQITCQQWKFNDSYYEKILKLGKPKYQQELAQAVYVANWIAPAIPEFAVWRKHFKEFTNLKGNKFKDLAKKNLLVNWTADLSKIWNDFKEVLAKSSEAIYTNMTPLKHLSSPLTPARPIGAL